MTNLIAHVYWNDDYEENYIRFINSIGGITGVFGNLQKILTGLKEGFYRIDGYVEVTNYRNLEPKSFFFYIPDRYNNPENQMLMISLNVFIRPDGKKMSEKEKRYSDLHRFLFSLPVPQGLPKYTGDYISIPPRHSVDVEALYRFL